MIADVHSYSQRRRKRLRHVRCFLNGEDVTSRSFYADTRRGVVRLYKLNAEGKRYIDPTGWPRRVAVEERHGVVRIVRAHRHRPMVRTLEGCAGQAVQMALTHPKIATISPSIVLHPKWAAAVLEERRVRPDAFGALPIEFDRSQARTSARLILRQRRVPA